MSGDHEPGLAAAPHAVESVRAYHQRTKHHLQRYAAGPGNLDWNAQPDPFRAWQGTRYYNLPRTPPAFSFPWSALDAARPAADCNVANLATLLRLSAAITAWKQYGDNRWALRANPSSGNLHPTETWVIAYWVDGLADGLYHYQVRHHALEWRAGSLTASDSPGLWLGFSSIHWREAWKYGERAFRYCQLDMGHMLAALAYAAALFGWRPRLVALDYDVLAHCLGTDRSEDYFGVEAEEPEVVVALQPASEPGPPPLPPLDWDEWSGAPSLLDPRPMYQWPVIDEVAAATRGIVPPSPASGRGAGGEGASFTPDASALLPNPPAAQVILNRRSAQAFDGRSVMPIAVFHRILAAMLPGGSPVWRIWDRTPRVHPVLLLHRIEGFPAGLYVLPRSDGGRSGMAAAMRQEFAWHRADDRLPLYRLLAAQAERTARTISCHQDIAAMSAFALMFLAEFDAPLEANPAAYRHLHWEAGMLGHCVTLEAEAAGWRGTGIGCFFDDADHEVLGLDDSRYQVIYHFAVGMPLDDPRISTLPAYA
jgi:SagB-type dehydrogenase family enzyme